MSTEINTEYVRKVYARCPVDSLNGGAPNPTPDFAAAKAAEQDVATAA